MIAHMKRPRAKSAIELACPLTRKQAEAIYAQGREWQEAGNLVLPSGPLTTPLRSAK